MILHACIAHQLVKEQHKEIQPLVTSTEQLDCENELVNQLIERIDSVMAIDTTRGNTVLLVLMLTGEHSLTCLKVIVVALIRQPSNLLL